MIAEDPQGNWVDAVAVDDIEAEDVMRYDHDGRTFAIYRSPDDAYFATDGICSHEHAYLSDGLVLGHIIECPKHNGRFDYRSGAAVKAPACDDLRSYRVRVDGGRLFIKIE